jgi:type I restriction enzyme S subunit
MVVKKGYKQTEVGVIPEDWEVRRIDCVCNLINGRGFKPHEWKTSGLPIIRIQNLNGVNDFNYFQGLYDKKLEILDGQLLFAWSGSRGTSFGPHLWRGPKGLLNYHTWKVEINEGKVDKGFFLYALRQLTSFIEDNAHGASALVHTQKWEMEGFQFPLPPTLAEQEAIASALSDADAWIESLEQLIAKKRQIKQGVMQELLTGKRRLPGFSGEWFSVPLKYYVTQFIVPMRDKPSFFSSDTPWCRIEDFDGIYLSASKSAQCVGSDTIRSMNLKVYPTGTLLVSCSADLGRCAIVARPLVTNQTFIGLVFETKLSCNLFFYYLISSLSDELNALSSGTTISYLSREQFEEFVVFAPRDKPEQTAIATVLSNMDTEIESLESKLAKAREIKQGMMQELLTGRIRLI